MEVNAQGQKAVRDPIDCFLEYPLVFTRTVGGARQDDITDLFAGRLYGKIAEKTEARASMCRLMITRRAGIAALGAATLKVRAREEVTSAAA
jgi:hypothetical protein